MLLVEQCDFLSEFGLGEFLFTFLYVVYVHHEICLLLHFSDGVVRLTLTFNISLLLGENENYKESTVLEMFGWRE